MIHTLSRSVLEDAARCKRKFLYKHILGLKEQESGSSASEGILIHAGLAAAFNYIKRHQDDRGEPLCSDARWDETNTILKDRAMLAMGQMLAAGKSEYRGESFDLSTKVQDEETVMRLGDVVQYYIDNQLLKDMANARVISVEENYKMPLVLAPPGAEMISEYESEPRYELEGQIDLILLRMYPDGRKVYEVYDHKSVDDVKKSMDFLRLDVQFLVYEWVVNEHLVQHTALHDENYTLEMVYNLIRRERPPGYGTREMRYNKDGRPAANNASTDPRDYLAQHRQAHSLQELAYVEQELVNLAFQALELKTMVSEEGAFSNGAFTRTVIKTGGEACSGCAYFTKCAAELIGHGQPDWGLVKP